MMSEGFDGRDEVGNSRVDGDLDWLILGASYMGFSSVGCKFAVALCRTEVRELCAAVRFFKRWLKENL